MQVEFDPGTISYRDILEVFLASHDPTTLNRQGPDFGEQYRSVIFYHSDEQKKIALATRDKLQASERALQSYREQKGIVNLGGSAQVAVGQQE